MINAGIPYTIILYLKGMRAIMFQLSGFYYECAACRIQFGARGFDAFGVEKANPRCLNAGT